MRARSSISTVALFLALLVPACTDSTSSPNSQRVETAERTGNPRLKTELFPAVDEGATEAPAGWKEAACNVPVEYVRRIRRGYYPGRSPEIVLLPRAPNYIGSFASMSHSGPWDYVQHVPLIFYGPATFEIKGNCRCPGR